MIFSPGRRAGPFAAAIGVALAVAIGVLPAARSAADDRPPKHVRDSAEATVDCRFDQVGTVVRTSTTRGKREAVGFGWWRNKNCPPVRATVTVTVEARVDGQWQTVGHEGKVRDRAGGKVKRARACAFCEGTRKTEWRSVIDVDLEDQDDSRETLYTPAVRLRCGAPD